MLEWLFTVTSFSLFVLPPPEIFSLGFSRVPVVCMPSGFKLLLA